MTSAAPAKALKLAHVSDLHILHIEGVKPWRYLGKRLTGGANLMMKRKKSHSHQVVVDAFAQIRAMDVDHIMVTGDLSNLALESEFDAGRRTLEAHAGGPQTVSVIPGNHDYYTLNSVRTARFESFFSPWMQSDIPVEDGKVYPYVKLLGDHAAIVGINSCIPSPPLFAVGKVGKAQRQRLQRLLQHPQLQGRFIVAMLHHHLEQPKVSKPRTEFLRHLRDQPQVKALLLESGVDLVVHGHNHQHHFSAHPNAKGQTTHICEAGSTSVAQHHNPHFGGKFNIYDLVPTQDGQGLRLGHVSTYLCAGEHKGFELWWEKSLVDA